MIVISEITALDFLKSKFKLTDMDARQVVAEMITADTKLENSIDKKIDDGFRNLKDVFMTKADKIELLKETYQVRTDLEKSMRTHFYWTVGIGFLILGSIITYSTLILTRLPAAQTGIVQPVKTEIIKK